MVKINMDRMDYARLQGVTAEITINEPRSIMIEMTNSYMTKLRASMVNALAAFADAAPGSIAQVTVDCPVSIVIDATAAKALIAQLDAMLGPNSAGKKP